jgi:hypothetical protein
MKKVPKTKKTFKNKRTKLLNLNWNKPKPTPRAPTQTIKKLPCSTRQLLKKYKRVPTRAKKPPKSNPVHAAQNVLLPIRNTWAAKFSQSG